MKRIGIAILMVATAFVVIGCQTQPKKQSEMIQPALTNQQLINLYSQSLEMRWSTPKGYTGTSEYEPNGTGIVEWGKGDHAGQWRISGNTVCTQWEGVREGREKCFRLVEVAPGKYNYYDVNGIYEGDGVVIH